MTKHTTDSKTTAYSIYNIEQKRRTKINPLDTIYPALPDKKYDVIYMDPPWDYGGKMQYDNTIIKNKNVDFKKKIFLSSASFKYPTLKLKQLKKLDIPSIMADDCLLFMWTTGPQMANSIELGESWNLKERTKLFSTFFLILIFIKHFYYIFGNSVDYWHHDRITRLLIKLTI